MVVSREGLSPPNRPNHQLPKNQTSIPRSIRRLNKIAFYQRAQAQGAANHDHDLIQDLSKRLDALWRYDKYIANAEGKAKLQDLWRSLKQQEQDNVRKLKELIAEEIKQGCF